MTEPVGIETVDRVALVSIDNPPVNAASHAVRQGLQDAILKANASEDVDVIVIYAKGRTFIAGADIKEFGKPPLSPWLPDLCNTIEDSQTSVIAVLHGTPLGGGLEVAMAAHARVALRGTRLGLPEVNLGILPGAGGTQRAPRLVGIAPALDMILTGRHVPVTEALELGLVDRIEDGEVRDVALAAAKLWRDGALVPRRTGDVSVTPDDAALAAAKEATLRKHPHLFSPLRCIEAVAASTLPITEGLKIERTLFNACLDSPQRAGLIHAFFIERAVAKIPERSETPRAFAKIGVVGGGLMGSGIATACLLAGLPVVLAEQTQDALERGRTAVQQNLAKAVARGKLSEARLQAIQDGDFVTTLDLDRLGDADIVIEAVFEDLDAKQSVFRALDRVCKPGAVLATNTSYLDINQIAAVTGRPQDVLGLHFFSPAHIMRLLEVVVSDHTAPDAVATGFALAKALRKVAVRAGVCDGFIGNRILATTRKVADYMVLAGATPQQVDDALEGFGFAMGPYRVLDLAGLDISWANRKRHAATRPAQERYVALGDRLCESGAFGRKAGRGYYLYGDSHGPNPDVAAFITAERAAGGITARTFEDEEIIARYMAAMVCEATRILEDGIALRPIDIDAVLLFGYGFPRFRGGPMHYADTIGAKELVSRIEGYAAEDPVFWTVPVLLRDMARDGSTFAMRN